jgi:hypothetical protein
MKQRLFGIVAALGILIAAGAGILYFTRGSHLVLEGKIQRVRLQPLEDGATFAAVDFRVTNPADYPFEVRLISVEIESRDGKFAEGILVHDGDLAGVFQRYPELGAKFNTSLKTGEVIASKATADRMLGVRFNVAPKAVEDRAKLVLRVKERDRGWSELVEVASK